MSITSERRPRILVVDDNERNRQILEQFLVGAAYEVRLAESGARALEILAEEPVDLVLLDVLMPGLDGFETCRRIRAMESGAEVAVVFLTALRDLGSQDQALESGADDFLSKPVNRTELLMRVRSLVWLKRIKSELHRGYALIREQRDALLESQREKAEYVGFLVHDLKSPLTGILANAEWLGLQTELSPATRDAAQDIRYSAMRLHRMVLTMLDVARSEERPFAPVRAPLQPAELLREVSERFRRTAADARQRIEVHAEGASQVAYVDREMVRRMLENLFDNALRHSPSDQVVQARCWWGQDGLLELAIADQGAGVPESHREDVFNKYSVLDTSGARRSSGMGLAFCRMVAEAHGGRIWMEDNAPRGCVVRVSLPGEETSQGDSATPLE